MPNRRVQLQARDRCILEALYLTPLTVEQLCRLSRVWPQPFYSWKTLLRRLAILEKAGLLRRFRYALPSPGAAPSYFRVSRDGYRLLVGDPRGDPPTRAVTAEVALALHAHAFALAEFIVTIFVAAKRLGTLVCDCWPDGALLIPGEGPRLSPDFVFVLRSASGQDFRFLVELDNGTEPIDSLLSHSVVWKLRRYMELHHAAAGNFRVLVVTTGGPSRARHVEEAAANIAREPRRSIVYSGALTDVLAADAPLTHGVFLDHRFRRAALLPRYHADARRAIRLDATLAWMPRSP